MTPDAATIDALRRDLALQIARHVARSGHNQISMAKSLGIPQPTLSRIVNGQVQETSLELLLRIAVRAGLPVVLQTGTDPAEAGVFVSGAPLPQRRHRSMLTDDAREGLARALQHLSPSQRLEAQLRHTEALTALCKAAPKRRARTA